MGLLFINHPASAYTQFLFSQVDIKWRLLLSISQGLTYTLHQLESKAFGKNVVGSRKVPHQRDLIKPSEVCQKYHPENTEPAPSIERVINIILLKQYNQLSRNKFKKTEY